ncbi:unnamed protein product [Tuber melanosporum]|uniref:(Perigord truffle) hypothetical protein n=1 Tax=Tuber melanosporum (strain Mel28) TaxID=656061 RepID=D5G5J9_TUBMM|nr:uncharacterized protein GSTUM_00004375001 [Tuber melanosporum]CAZ79792.1 unnamed protein product [Tuber melanosporum]
MCFGFTKIWRRKLKKSTANAAEKPVSASTSTTSPPTPVPVYKPPPNIRLDGHITAAAAMDNTPVTKNEKPQTTTPPSKPTPSTTYLSAPSPSYSSGIRSHSTLSPGSHFGETTPSISCSGGHHSSSYHSSSGSSSSGGGGGGGCSSSSSGGGGGSGF